MKLTVLGAARAVTGSCFLVEAPGVPPVPLNTMFPAPADFRPTGLMLTAAVAVTANPTCAEGVPLTTVASQEDAAVPGTKLTVMFVSPVIVAGT